MVLHHGASHVSDLWRELSAEQLSGVSPETNPLSTQMSSGNQLKTKTLTDKSRALRHHRSLLLY
jgi:hypothetical protein